ncbi:MAG TPA: SprT family zinc-dependent metalloprotease [Caulobacteraceae bacterium]|nr:SprT family zinc-dependent metalloprotease [Caulobacteraceae bacterium]
MRSQSIRPTHGDLVDADGAPVRLRVNPRARRVSIRIDSASGEVIATAPSPRRIDEAMAFVARRRGWIEARLRELPRAQPFEPGVVIEVAGSPCELVSSAGRPRWRPADEDQPLALLAPGEGPPFARAVANALKAEARRVLLERTALHARTLGKPAPAVAIADPRGRWGSCTPPRRGGFGASLEVGRVRYSWRLILAPPAVLDYVAAHECAHLVEANHSPRFWAVVKGLVGDHRPYRAWLRANGPRLHAMGR